jgi:hypothetical protein
MAPQRKTVRTIKTFDQDILYSYSGFLHVIKRSAQIGADAAFLKEDEAEWLDCPARNGLTMLPIVTESRCAFCVSLGSASRASYRAALTFHWRFEGRRRPTLQRVSSRTLRLHERGFE